MSQKEDERAKRIIRAEMVRADVSYVELADRLSAAGQIATVASLRNKLSRGTFTAEFFLQCLEALGVKTLRLED